MRVTITTPPGIFAEGTLKGVMSEQGAPYPHLVVEMSVAGVSDPVKVTLDELDLNTIGPSTTAANRGTTPSLVVFRSMLRIPPQNNGGKK